MVFLMGYHTFPNRTIVAYELPVDLTIAPVTILSPLQLYYIRKH